MPCHDKYFELYIRQQYANTVAQYCAFEGSLTFRKYYAVDIEGDARANEILTDVRNNAVTIDQPLLYLNYQNPDEAINASLVVFVTDSTEDCNGKVTEVFALYFTIENWPLGLVPSTKSCKPVVLPDGIEIGPLNRIERNETKRTENTIKNRYYDDGFFDYFNYENGRLLQTDNDLDNFTTPVKIENVTKSVKQWAITNSRKKTKSQTQKVSLKEIQKHFQSESHTDARPHQQR